MGAFVSIFYTILTIPITLPVGILLGHQNFIHIAIPLLFISLVTIGIIQFINRKVVGEDTGKYFKLEIISSIISMTMIFSILFNRNK